MRNKIVVFTTGGTIAGANEKHSGQLRRLEDRLHSDEPQPKSADDILAEFPEMEEVAEIELVDLMGVDSMYIGSSIWKQLATVAFEYVQRPDISGLVMLTGTNTMDYIAIAEALMIQNLDKPLVITGSMDKDDRSQKNRHLVDSARVAAYSRINEVVVCFSGDHESTFTNVYRGANVLELNPYVNNAFGCEFEGPLASVSSGQITLADGYKSPKHSQAPQLTAVGTEMVGRIIYAPGVAGIPSARFLQDWGHEGLVIDAGVQVAANDTLYPLIKECLQRGIAVAVTSTNTKYMTGEVERKDTELKKLGMVELDKMHRNKAHVKLAWALPQAGGDMRELQRIMYTNFAGEMNYLKQG